MKIAVLIILSYLVGSINPAYIIGRMKGYDIRERGSGNAGASNVVINVGKKAGAFTAVFDLLKAFFCYKLGEFVFPFTTVVAVICGVMCVIGHIFPFYLKFKGGKGFACIGGLILGFNFKVFFIMLLFAILVVMTFDYICIVTSLTALTFPVIYMTMTHDLTGAVFLALMGYIIVIKHIPNFNRIKHGTEARISGIRHRDEEEERIRRNLEKMNKKDDE